MGGGGEALVSAVADVARDFAAERKERQARRHLDKADFDRLAAAGFLGTGLPSTDGGLWTSVAASTRPVAEALRVLAGADPSVALVASMHPAVLSFWLAPDVDDEHARAWQAQRAEVFATVAGGAWWGTITSEPGSGGDVARSKARAEPTGGDNRYALTGAKHFGSGSGISSYMITTAVPDGEEEPDWYYVAVSGAPWDGSTGMRLLAEWDGHGMTATQSHAFRFEGFPAVRFAWPGHFKDIIAAASPFVGAVFTAVVTGIVQTAVDLARVQLEPKHEQLRPYEQVEWANAEMEAWVIDQAYEGMLRAVESGAANARGVVLRAKTAIAQLAESCLLRVCRVMGGGTFARHSPFGHWFEDVRALGFLRPPWGLAYDGLFVESFTAPPR